MSRQAHIRFSLLALWAAAQAELRSTCTVAVYESHVAGARLIDARENTLTIASTSTFARDQLEERVGAEAIARAVAGITGRWPEIRFEVAAQVLLLSPALRSEYE